MVAKRMFLVKLHDLYKNLKGKNVSFIGFEISKTVWSNQINIIPVSMKMMATMMKWFGTFISIEKCGMIMAPLFTEKQEESLKKSGKFVTWKNNEFIGIKEDEIVFKNFANALKSGGKLLVNTPSDLGGSDAHDHDDESFIEEHARVGYSKKEITEKLERAGLEVTDFRYSYGKYGTISWRLGIKYPILIAGVSKILILLLPFYYLFTMWLVLILMWLDVKSDNKEGTGVIVLAEKK